MLKNTEKVSILSGKWKNISDSAEYKRIFLRFLYEKQLAFLSALLIDKHGSLYSVIDGAIHGVVVTVLWWIFDQGHEQIKASAKVDEADRKRKESNKNNQQ